jgi:hypothetical protein
MATYAHIDRTDRRYFEDVLPDNIERLAFINFFAHVERDFKRNKRAFTTPNRLSKKPPKHRIASTQTLKEPVMPQATRLNDD